MNDPGPDHFLVHLELLRERVPSFDVYPFSLPAVRALETLPLHPKVTIFIGDNGTGKSTLLEAITVGLGLNAEGGSRNFNFSTRSSESSLAGALRLVRSVRRPRTGFFLRAESFFNVATEIEALDASSAPSRDNPPIGPAYGDRALHEQSHRESFFALFQNRFAGCGNDLTANTSGVCPECGTKIAEVRRS